MIKFMLRDIVEAADIFSKIVQQPFKGSVAFKIARLIRELDKEMETFSTERQKIVDKYALRDENGELVVDENNNFTIPTDKIVMANEEFSSLLDTEIEINAEKLDSDIMELLEITPQEIMKIEKFFK